jgi:hypothetical protein
MLFYCKLVEIMILASKKAESHFYANLKEYYIQTILMTSHKNVAPALEAFESLVLNLKRKIP